jgi:hypothetical protein
MPAPWVSYWSLLLSEDKSLASCTSTRMTGNLQLSEKTACRSTWSEGAAASKRHSVHHIAEIAGALAVLLGSSCSISTC